MLLCKIIILPLLAFATVVSCRQSGEMQLPQEFYDKSGNTNPANPSDPGLDPSKPADQDAIDRNDPGNIPVEKDAVMSFQNGCRTHPILGNIREDALLNFFDSRVSLERTVNFYSDASCLKYRYTIQTNASYGSGIYGLKNLNSRTPLISVSAKLYVYDNNIALELSNSRFCGVTGYEVGSGKNLTGPCVFPKGTWLLKAFPEGVDMPGIAKNSSGIEFAELSEDPERPLWKLTKDQSLMTIDGKLNSFYSFCDLRKRLAGSIWVSGSNITVLNQYLRTDNCNDVGYEIRRSYLLSSSKLYDLVGRVYSVELVMQLATATVLADETLGEFNRYQYANKNNWKLKEPVEVNGLSISFKWELAKGAVSKQYWTTAVDQAIESLPAKTLKVVTSNGYIIDESATYNAP